MMVFIDTPQEHAVIPIIDRDEEQPTPLAANPLSAPDAAQAFPERD